MALNTFSTANRLGTSFLGKKLLRKDGQESFDATRKEKMKRDFLATAYNQRSRECEKF